MQEETCTKLYAELPYLFCYVEGECAVYLRNFAKHQRNACKHRCREGKKTTFLRNKFTSGSDSKREGFTFDILFGRFNR